MRFNFLTKSSSRSLALKEKNCDDEAKHKEKMRKKDLKKKTKILVVDDNKDAANMLGKLLQRVGYAVDVFYDSVKADAAVSKNEFDAALLDIAMPEVDGYRLAKNIRNDLGSDMLLIAITGYGQLHDKEKAKKAGFDYHITKPVSIQELKDILSSSLQ